MIDYGSMIKGLHSVMQFRCLNTKIFCYGEDFTTTTQQSSTSMDCNVVSLLLTINYGHLIKEMNKEMNFWCRND